MSSACPHTTRPDGTCPTCERTAAALIVTTPTPYARPTK